MRLRKLLLTDMDEAARIHRVAFEDRLPWLPRLHTPEEDRNYYRGRIVVEDGRLAAARGSGSFLPCAISEAAKPAGTPVPEFTFVAEQGTALI